MQSRGKSGKGPPAPTQGRRVWRSITKFKAIEANGPSRLPLNDLYVGEFIQEQGN